MSHINKSTTYEERNHYKYYDYWLKSSKIAGYSSVDTAICELYKKLESRDKVGEVLGVTGPAVAYQLKRMKIKMNPPGKNHENLKGRKAIHYVGNVPLVEWCRLHDVSYATILWRMREGMMLRDAIRIPINTKYSRKKEKNGRYKGKRN